MDVQAQGTTAKAPAGKKSTIYGLIFGVGFLVFGLIILLMEVQASEAYLLHGAVVTFQANYNILLQPWNLLTGNLDLYTAKAVVWGWGVELTYFMCIVGWEIARSAVSIYNPKLAGWMRTGALVLVAFNFWTNFQYGNLASGAWGQFGFAFLTSFCSAVFPFAGTYILDRTFASHTSTLKKSPVLTLGLGGLLILFGLSIILMEVQASEAFLLHLPVTTFHNNLDTAMQPINLMQGHLDLNTAKAVIWGWGVEFVYFLCIIGWEITASAFGYHNPKLAGWFKTGALVLVAINLWSNIQYGTLPSGIWGQIAFSLMTCFGSAFFPLVGTYLIERTVSH